MKYSLNQQLAINSIGKNIVVSASAGAGKTAVLTARLTKRIIEDKISISNILAMTFTDAAASEMKIRLFKSLTNIAENSSDTKQIDYCQQQLVLLGTANVSTIHSFCLSVIKENYYIINLAPSIIENLLSDDQLIQIHENVFNETFNYFNTTNSESLNNLCMYLSCSPTNFENLKSYAKQIAMAAYGAFNSDEFFNLIQSSYYPINKFSEIHNRFLEPYFESINVLLINIQNSLQSIIQNNNILEEEKIRVTTDSNIKKVENCLNLLNVENYPEFYISFKNLVESILPVPKNTELKELRGNYNNAIKKLVSAVISQDMAVESNNSCCEISNLLAQFSKKYFELFIEYKKNIGAMDFNDMEKFAYDILSFDNQSVAKKYQKRFTDILVDEFQDTNDIQNNIINMISKVNNVFRVGDVKQSIYRFRNAKPLIMANLIENLDCSNDVIYLNENYRSKKSIVEYNNQLFDILMNIQGINQKYNKYDFVEIGTPQQDDNHNLCVEFCSLENDNNEDSVIVDDEISDDESESFGDIKADYIANKIMQMRNTTKYTRFSDYCILVRSHEIKNLIRFTFDKYNIPYSMDIKSGFYKTNVVMDIIAWLKFINTKNEISLISILSSSFYLDDFDKISEYSLNKKCNTLFDYLTSIDHKIIKDYYLLLEFSKTNRIYDLVSKIIQINNYYESYTTNQQRTNIDLLMDKIRMYEKTNTNSLSLYVEYINNISKLKSSEAIYENPEDDCVKIMTVHHSKGLQFPVVFYWSNSTTKIRDSLVDDKLGVGLDYISLPMRLKFNTVQKAAIAYKNTLDEFAENTRLLYVALTRAQDKLIMVDKYNPKFEHKKIDLNAFYLKKGFTSLVLPASENITDYYKHNIIDCNYQSGFSNQHTSNHTSKIIRYNNEGIILIKVKPSFHNNKKFDINLNKVSLTHGNIIHKIIEDLPDSMWTAQMIQKLNILVTKEDIEKILRLQKNEIFKNLMSQTIYKEFKYSHIIDNTIINGIIDYMAMSKELITIIDFKTDISVDRSYYLDSYSTQLKQYKKDISIIYPNHQVQSYIYSFAIEEMIRVD